MILIIEIKEWKRRREEYAVYMTTCSALVNLITDSAPKDFYKSLKNLDLGYATKTPCEYVTHL